jgi:enoyl-CoA hydratase
MDTSSGSLQVTRMENKILHVRLNRPEKMNALSSELMKEFYEILRQVKEDKRIRSLLITGDTKAFSVGADIHQLGELNSQTALEFSRRGQCIFRTLEQLGKPSLALIEGFALGGGCELAMAATLRIATPAASFGLPEVKLGIMPCFGGTQRLARLIGKGRALEMCISGKIIKATEACTHGLINEMVPAEKIHARGKEILTAFNALAPLALQHILRAIDQGYDLNMSDALEMEAENFALCCATKDKDEGVSAFLEKRAAQFNGE